MNFKKGYIINDKFEIKHFIDSFTYCETYSATPCSLSNKLNINIRAYWFNV